MYVHVLIYVCISICINGQVVHNELVQGIVTPFPLRAQSHLERNPTSSAVPLRAQSHLECNPTSSTIPLRAQSHLDRAWCIMSE